MFHKALKLRWNFHKWSFLVVHYLCRKHYYFFVSSFLFRKCPIDAVDCNCLSLDPAGLIGKEYTHCKQWPSASLPQHFLFMYLSFLKTWDILNSIRNNSNFSSASSWRRCIIFSLITMFTIRFWYISFANLRKMLSFLLLMCRGAHVSIEMIVWIFSYSLLVWYTESVH